jgi:signal transduction histidine kinase
VREQRDDMSKANAVRSVADWIPACQWSFNRARCFHYIGGDSAAIFHRAASDLLRCHVSAIDDPKASWAACLDRIFSGEARFESAPLASQNGYTLVHVPIHEPNGSVAYAAGFAYRAGLPVPSVSELELAAFGILQIVEAERARTDRFLHDVVAQCLTSTGLELELQRLELEGLGVELPDRARRSTLARRDPRSNQKFSREPEDPNRLRRP